MSTLHFSTDKLHPFLSDAAIESQYSRAEAANRMLHEGTGKGNDFLGWVDLPTQLTAEFLKDIQATAATLRSSCQVVVIAGIGGSYLGAKSVIEALNPSFDGLTLPRESPLIVYAGHHINEDYLAELLDFLKGKSFGIVNISKSGTTTETALAFRLLKNLLEKQAGKEEARRRIVAITDAQKGALRALAQQEGYKTYTIPDNVGGRFSVLTAVGLLPIAIAGHDIEQLVDGACRMSERCTPDVPIAQNPAARYAIVRNALYQSGKKIELLVNYHPKLHFVSEWWKQLFGESEGKDHLGIFPASVDLTTDLHSMGQWIQDGERTLFETVLSIGEPNRTLEIPGDSDNLDGLNFLAGKRISEVNRMAELGTQIAHMDGGVPNLRLELPALNAQYLGQLLFFFEKACGISGYLLGVNPFDQPGVEDYKRNMFALLGKPGYEDATKAIQAKL
jgi:glucose-6-phosphate isomerase